MIPRTKHLVVASIACLTLLLAGGVSLVPRGTEALFDSFASPALLIESVEGERDVIVERSSLREDMREKMRGTLRAYIDSSKKEQDEATRAYEIPPTVREETKEDESTTTVTPLLCGGVAGGDAPVTSWGPVRITVGEGARVLRTVEEDALGVPLHALQLPLESRVEDAPACLPQGMIGVLVDGTVVTPNTPITTIFEGLAGYAIDGFPIFSNFEDGKEVVNADLDVCHGHVHEIVDQGVIRSVYHYHITEEAPYTLGCFKGAPVE